MQGKEKGSSLLDPLPAEKKRTGPSLARAEGKREGKELLFLKQTQREGEKNPDLDRQRRWPAIFFERTEWAKKERNSAIHREERVRKPLTTGEGEKEEKREGLP